MSLEKRAYTSAEIIAWAETLDAALRRAVNDQPSVYKGTGLQVEGEDAASFFERFTNPATGHVLYLVPDVFAEIMPDSEMTEDAILKEWTGLLGGLSSVEGVEPVDPSVKAGETTTSAWDRITGWITSWFSTGESK